MHYKFKPSHSAFTLIELLVVITIISILASFSAPQFIQKITKAKLLEVYSFSNALQTSIEEHVITNGTFPTTTQFNALKAQQSLSEKSVISSSNIEQNQGVTGTIKIQLKEESAIEANQYFLFARTTSAQWTCTSTLPSELLSGHCKTISSNEDTE
ncbi:pilin [Marinomonas sp. 2405UD68-3]|uniref:pilin n=1 Tax=Marinomonas sp. 2405UD68-3 TaxID=3391835 RepID=UPI0039C9E6E0